MQPPQNPYGTPNPYGPPPTPNGQTPRGTVSLDVIGEAWKLVQANLGTWIGAILINGVITLILAGIQFSLQSPVSSGMALPPGSNPAMGAFMRQPTAASSIMQLVVTVISAVLAGGLIKMGLETVQTGRTQIGTMFSLGSSTVMFVLANILVSIMLGISFVLCVIPFFIVASGLLITGPILIDKQLNCIEAISQSWTKMSPHLMSGAVLVLVLFLLNLVGVCACGIGAFFTYPISFVALSLVYRDVNGVQANFGGAPISDPRF